MSKFKTLDTYNESLNGGYRLAPLNFTTLDGDDYVISNMAGEYLVVSKPNLHAFIKHKLSPAEPIYNELKSKHFLIDSDSNVAMDLMALKVRTKMSRLADFTGLHIFVVTLRCEHSCPYCQVSRQSEDRAAYDMSKETADKGLELVFKSPSPAIKIEFQGGESMLNFDIVKYIVEEAEKINVIERRDLQFVIATNLAVLTDEILEYCRDHRIHISSSLDGPKELHNKNRPRPGGDSYERTIQGIKRVRDKLGRDQVSALMTTTEASLEQPIEIINEYLKQGFDGIFLRPLSPYGFAIKTKSYKAYDVDEWLDFYFKGLEYIIELNRSGTFFVEQYAAIILNKMLTPFGTGYVDLTSPAGIGIGALVYNYNGDVYASDESRMLAEMGDKHFRLGNVHENNWEEMLTSEQLLGPLEESFAGSAPMCSDCAFEPYCGSEPVFHHATQGDYLGLKPTSSFCRRNMAIFRRLIKLMETDSEVKSIFMKWVRI